MDRVRKLKFGLWLLLGLALSVAAARFLFGLGATTNLSDATPWGLWIGFDVLSGVALAAGGFIVTAVVYIFGLERYHSVVRPAVLTAFLGYLAVAVGLLFDLGLPWNIWHMIVFWNPRSPLFEVGWCVMLYLTVLGLEFLPVPAEEFRPLARIRRFLLRVRLPLVILGIGLSTLHQSSLGSLFLIMPYHLHPLWYSPVLPVLFFVSAVALGLLMVMFESHFTAFVYRRKPETELLAKLGGAARWVLLAYLGLRLGDLLARGKIRDSWAGGWHSWMFWIELALMVFAPLVLLSVPRLGMGRRIQWLAAAVGVFGIVLNRINVGGLAHLRANGFSYVPSWTEIAISAGIVAGAALLFLFMIEHFRIWEERPADPEADPRRLPEFDNVGSTWLGVPNVAARTVCSLAFVGAAAFGFSLLEGDPAATRGTPATPVHHARGGDVLWIDGNLDGFGTPFPHEDHKKRLGAKASCVHCHHMNLPRDQNSGCHQCHGDMYLAVDSFRHDWHASPSGARLACYECHARGPARAAETSKPCKECHKDLLPAAAEMKVRHYQAPGYVQAMHKLCVSCHARSAAAVRKPDLPRCAACHKERRNIMDAGRLEARRSLGSSHTVLPPY